MDALNKTNSMNLFLRSDFRSAQDIDSLHIANSHNLHTIKSRVMIGDANNANATLFCLADNV